MLRKSQVALEYLLMMGIAFLILVPLFNYINSYTVQTRSDLKRNALEDSLEQLVESSEMVYSQGEPAKITVNMYIPDGVVDQTIYNHSIVVGYEMSGLRTDLVVHSDAPLKGSLPRETGGYEVELKAEENYVNISYG